MTASDTPRRTSAGLPPEAGCVAALRRAWLKQAAATAVFGWAAASSVPLARANVGGADTSFYDNFKGMRLLDQSGRTLQLPSLKGRVVLINFIFTACSTVCPLQTHALAEMQRQMKPDLRRRVRLLSVSLDALSDTPQTLSAFAAKYRVDHSNWSFVTGRPEDIYRLAETLALFRNGKGQGPLEEHNTSLWLVDAQGVLRMRYGGTPPDTARLAREMTTLAELSAAHAPREAERTR